MIIDFPDDKEVVIQRMYQIIPRVFEHDLVVAGEWLLFEKIKIFY